MDRKCLEDVFDVRVVKPFDACRTPCPPKGTVGQCYRMDSEFFAVRFRKPVTDTDGGVWVPVDDDELNDDNYLQILFKHDEVEAV